MTGGASGIDLASGQRLAAEGAQASIWDIDQAGMQKTGCAAHAVQLDPADVASVRAAARPTIGALMRSKIPMNRFGTIGEVAALTCSLMGLEASFSKAAVFDCTGGCSTS